MVSIARVRVESDFKCLSHVLGVSHYSFTIMDNCVGQYYLLKSESKYLYNNNNIQTLLYFIRSSLLAYRYKIKETNSQDQSCQYVISNLLKYTVTVFDHI